MQLFVQLTSINPFIWRYLDLLFLPTPLVSAQAVVLRVGMVASQFADPTSNYS